MSKLRIGACLFAGVILVFGWSRLEFDVDVLNLLPEEHPIVRGVKTYQRHFADARELIITIRSKDAETSALAAESLGKKLQETPSLTTSVTWDSPWRGQPEDLGEFVAYLWLNQPPETFGDLTNRLSSERLEEVLRATTERLATSMSPDEIGKLSYDPFGFLRLPSDLSNAALHGGRSPFSSTDGTFRLLFVQAPKEVRSYRQAESWLQSVEGAVERWRRETSITNKLEVGYTGGPAFAAEIGGGMERDMKYSVGGTLVIVAALFWFAHRRWLPLLWMVFLLTLIVLGTLAMGGLLLGKLNVVGVGFAAILLGLSVDYALILYQEWQKESDLSPSQIRQRVAPGIFWAALTTAGAFLALAFSSLPGLAQLGILVAVGILIAAAVFLFTFLLPLKRDTASAKTGDKPKLSQPMGDRLLGTCSRLAWCVTAFGAVVALVLLRHQPLLDNRSDILGPSQSKARSVLNTINRELGGEEEPLWVLVHGASESEVGSRLQRLEATLSELADGRVFSSFSLPWIWPRPDYQMANHSAALHLVEQRPVLEAAAVAHGFTTNAMAVTWKILDFWKKSAGSSKVVWPPSGSFNWILNKISAKTEGEVIALGTISPVRGLANDVLSQAAERIGAVEGAVLSGWKLLGTAVLDLVWRDLRTTVILVSMMLVGLLWLAFRNFTEVFLSVANLAFTVLSLLGAMVAMGWSWNLMNLTALPLLLGVGVDYSIHLQLALRRARGNIVAVWNTVGRAVFLCGITTVAGFGSLAFSSNMGLSSLGRVCAAGLGIATLTSLILLPFWWRALRGGRHKDVFRSSSSSDAETAPHEPSKFYGRRFWMVGLCIAGVLPERVLKRIAYAAADAYWTLFRPRREVVVANLLPLCRGDTKLAEEKGQFLIRGFSQKVIDLWRYERGFDFDGKFGGLRGWDEFVAARHSGKGVLLISAHLGNWELGGLWLTQHGYSLKVISLPEPDEGLTNLRKSCRAKYSVP